MRSNFSHFLVRLKDGNHGRERLILGSCLMPSGPAFGLMTPRSSGAPSAPPPCLISPLGQRSHAEQLSLWEGDQPCSQTGSLWGFLGGWWGGAPTDPVAGGVRRCGHLPRGHLRIGWTLGPVPQRRSQTEEEGVCPSVGREEGGRGKERRREGRGGTGRKREAGEGNRGGGGGGGRRAGAAPGAEPAAARARGGGRAHRSGCGALVGWSPPSPRRRPLPPPTARPPRGGWRRESTVKVRARSRGDGVRLLQLPAQGHLLGHRWAHPEGSSSPASAPRPPGTRVPLRPAPTPSPRAPRRAALDPRRAIPLGGPSR